MCQGRAGAAPCPPAERDGGRGRSPFLPFLPAIPSQAGVETPRNGLRGTRSVYPAGIPPSVPASPLAPGDAAAPGWPCLGQAVPGESRAWGKPCPGKSRALGKAVAALLLLIQVSTDRRRGRPVVVHSQLRQNGARRKRCCGKQGQNSLSR